MGLTGVLFLTAFFGIFTLTLQYDYTKNTFQVDLDHFSFASNGTFKIKYLLNDKWWNPSLAASPIFFYTGNEGEVEYFADNSGFIWEIAPSFNALVVFAEHRYYGESMPFGNKSFSDPSYSGYLTSAQALADYIELIEHLKEVYPKKRGLSTPVIAFGGSYGGMLAAWIRMKYPAVITGALAASAPIWQFPNMTDCESFNIVTTGAYRESSSENCVNIIKDSWGAIDKLSATSDGKKWLTENFHLCKPLNYSEDLKGFLTNMYYNLAMANYPYPSTFLGNLPAHPVREFCNLIRTDDHKDRPLLQAISKGVNLYSNFTGTLKCLDIFSDTPQLGLMGWEYQTCTEMVMPFCDSGNTMFEKSTWDINKISDHCYEQYKVRPKVNYADHLYGGRNIDWASNIIFSNGLLDPWSSGGVLNNVSETAIAVIIPEGAHHLDLRASNIHDPISVRQARKMYKGIFKQWIHPHW